MKMVDRKFRMTPKNDSQSDTQETKNDTQEAKNDTNNRGIKLNFL